MFFRSLMPLTMAMLTALSLLQTGCRLRDFGGNSSLQEDKTGQRDLKVKNTLTGESDFKKTDIDVSDSEIAELHKLGLANNHTWPVATLTDGFRSSNLQVLYVADAGKIVGYVIMQEMKSSGFIMIHDTGLDIDHLEDQDVIDLLRAQLGKIESKFNYPLISVTSNEHAYYVEALEFKLEFHDTKVEGLTVPALDENTQTFQIGDHFFVRGDAPKTLLETLKSPKMKQTTFLKPANIEFIHKPRAIAILNNAGFVDAKRKNGAKRQEINLDEIGQKLAKDFIISLNMDIPMSTALLGRAGIGKTYQAELLFQKLIQGDFDQDLPPGFRDKLIVFILDMDRFEQGAHYKGVSNTRRLALKELVGNGMRALLMADEGHLAARPTTSGEPNLLPAMKPEMAKGDMLVYLLSTQAEFDRDITEKDAPLANRFEQEQYPILSFENTVKIVEIKFMKNLDVEGMSKNDFARLLYEAYLTIQPDGTMRLLERLVNNLKATMRIEKVNSINQDYFESYFRKRYQLPSTYHFPTTAYITQVRANAKAALIRDFSQGGQPIDPVLLKTLDDAVLGSFTDDRKAKINMITAPEGSGRTHFAEIFATATGRNHVQIKLGPNSTLDTIKRDLVTKIMRPIGIGNALAVISFEDIEKAPSYVQDQLIDLLQAGKWEELKPDGYLDYSIQGVVAFLERTEGDASTPGSIRDIKLGARSDATYENIVKTTMIDQFAKSSLLRGINPNSDLMKSLVAFYIGSNKERDTSTKAEDIQRNVASFLIEQASDACSLIHAATKANEQH